MSQEDCLTDEQMGQLKPLLKKLEDDWFALTGKRLYARFEEQANVGPGGAPEEVDYDILIENADLREPHRIVTY